MKLKYIILAVLPLLVSASSAERFGILNCYQNSCDLKYTATLSTYDLYSEENLVRDENYGFYRRSKILPASKVLKIYCKNSTLDEIPAKLFEKFSELREFDATNVTLEKISRDDFKSAQKLYNLSLSHNKIEKLSNVVFMYLKNLSSVDLSHNQISEIHDAAFEDMSSNLTAVNLSFNKIEKFPENFFLLLGRQTENPLTINLESNEIYDIVQLNASDDKTVAIQFLNLQNNKLSAFEPSKLKIAELILNDNRVEKLNINPTIEVLHVDNNKLKELFVSASMRNVSARNNEIGELKCDKTLSLEVLVLSGNKLSNGIFAELKHADKMRILDLSSNKLGALSVDSFAEMTQLEKLHLSDSHIVKISYGIFAHQSHLKVLNISYNNLGFVDYHMFTTLTDLATWDISGNNLTKLKDYDTYRDIFKHLSTIALEDNNFHCEYLSKLRLSLEKQMIKIDDPLRPVKNDSSVKGVSCSTKTSQKVEQVPNDADNQKLSEKLSEVVDTLDKMASQVNDLKLNEVKLQESIREEIKAQIKLSTANLTGVNQRQMNPVEQSLAHDQMIRRMDEQSLEIAKHRVEIGKLWMISKVDASTKTEPQANHDPKPSATSTELIVPALVVIIVVMSLALAFCYAKSYLKTKLVQFRHQPRLSRRNSVNTITTFDNSSV